MRGQSPLDGMFAVGGGGVRSIDTPRHSGSGGGVAHAFSAGTTSKGRDVDWFEREETTELERRREGEETTRLLKP